MIRYDIGLRELKKQIRDHDSKWLDDAEELTEKFKVTGAYFDHTTIWRRVVRVYMAVQHNKCAFCERKFEGPKTGGTREFDVEHFRPKSSVKAWPPQRLRTQLPEGFPVSAGAALGYFLLPYHPYNYSVACKPCNSSFKSNYFPISGSRQLEGENPNQMQSEKPYLIYPLGHFDSDPENIIEYYGVIARPRFRHGERYHRAVATVVFFGLNDREEHLQERAEKISNLYLALEGSNAAKAVKRRLSRAAVGRLISEKSSHTNCMRSFKRLYEKRRSQAEEVIKGVTKLLESGS